MCRFADVRIAQIPECNNEYRLDGYVKRHAAENNVTCFNMCRVDMYMALVLCKEYGNHSQAV